MHKEVLTNQQIEILPLIKQFYKKYYLVGGTAIALYLGHRRSIDFDLFTSERVQRKTIKNILESSKFPIEKIIYEEEGQVHISVNSVKITFFQFPHIIPLQQSFENIIRIPSLLDLAAMKAYALGGRAKWKDYVDLYFLLKTNFSFQEIVQKASDIFTQFFNEKLFREQLAYFTDIDYSEEVDYLIPASSEKKIKQFLTEIATRPF